MQITSMADIFISYAREDREVAHTLAQVLEGFGWSVWWDTRLMAGEIWDEMIERELKATHSVVVLWSARSVNSRWVRKEARYGDTKRMLFPALIEAANIPLEFSDVHAEDLRGWTGDPSHKGLRDLVDALAILPGEPALGQPKQAAQEQKHPKLQAKPTAKKPSTPEELPSLSVFRDVDQPWCPEMAVLPVGHFMMGAPDTDEEADDVEKPRHKVAIAYRLAVGRYPVTFEEYEWFCDTVGRDKPENEDGARGRRPVINVIWDDAKAYSAWLSAISGKAYRLLSEAEWEYACRAGTQTRYSCGDSITEKDANFDANVGEPTEVGSYPANPWGLFDMHGNCSEWVEDAWHHDYRGALGDGGAWTIGSSKNRVVRGGNWRTNPGALRSTSRLGIYPHPTNRFDTCGFRVARTID